MAKEDFTTYDESDANGRYDRTLESGQRLGITALNRTDDNHHVTKSMGAGHFTDFEHALDIYMDVVSDEESFYWVGTVWGVSNHKNDFEYHVANGYPCIFIGIKATTTNGEYAIMLLGVTDAGDRNEQHSDLHGVGGDFTLNEDTTYYLKVKRVTSTDKVYLGVYSTANLRDAGDGTDGDVGNIAFDGRDFDDTDFEYIYGSSSIHRNDSRIMTGYVENLDLQEGAVGRSHGYIIG